MAHYVCVKWFHYFTFGGKGQVSALNKGESMGAIRYQIHGLLLLLFYSHGLIGS